MYLILLLSLFITAGCANLGTNVTGTGNTVTLSWNEQYPLARQLKHDNRIRLQAVYLVNGKLVNEMFSSIKRGEQSEINFILPDSLKAMPDSEICLYIKPSATFSTLPIRPADSSRRDTGGFRYPAWEEALRNNMRQQRTTRILQQLEQESVSTQALLERSEQLLLQRGIREPQDCIRADTTKSLEKERPFDVVELAQHDVATRKICVRQARNVMGLVPHLDIPASISEAAKFNSRKGQAKTFMRDLKNWFSFVGAGYKPEIGTLDDTLPISPQALTLITKQNIDKSDLIAIGGGILDAYDGCVEDTNKQLKTKLAAWKQFLLRSPEREREYAEYTRQECHKELDNHQYLIKRNLELRQQIAAQTGATHISPIALPKDRQTLDSQMCSIP